jgi:hypothetical protein
VSLQFSPLIFLQFLLCHVCFLCCFIKTICNM